MIDGLNRREGEIAPGIVQYLNLRSDILYWRNNSGVFSPRPGAFIRAGKTGSGDYIACQAYA